MKKINKFLLLLTLICPTTISVTSVYAQDLSPADEAQIMLRVVDLFEEYERYAGIDEDFSNYASSFRALFENGQSSVYNDLLGISSEESLPIRDYVQLMGQQSSTTRVEVKNIQRKSISKDGNISKIVCTFDKYVNITNKCGIEFSSDYFNATDYKLTATIVHDASNNSCLFESIEGSVEHIRELGEDYRIFKNTSPRDRDVLYNGKPVEFNAMGQAFISGQGSFYYKDPEVMLKLVEDDAQCHIWHMAYKAKPWRVKPHYDIGLGNALSMSGAEPLNTVKSAGSSFGLELGYVVPSKSKIKLGVFAGINMSQYGLEMATSVHDYYYETSADVDKDAYIRHYKNLSISQKEQFSDLCVPVYADISFHFSQMVSLYVDLGVKLNVSMSRKINDVVGNAYVYGVYPQYDNLYLDEGWGMNGFGNVQFTGDNISEDVGKASSGVDIFGAAGIRITIPKTPFAVDLGVNYLMGLGNIMNTSENRVILNGNVAESSAVVFNTINGTTSSEHIRNLSGALTNLKRQALRFSIGMLCKF